MSPWGLTYYIQIVRNWCDYVLNKQTTVGKEEKKIENNRKEVEKEKEEIENNRKDVAKEKMI